MFCGGISDYSGLEKLRPNEGPLIKHRDLAGVGITLRWYQHDFDLLQTQRASERPRGPLIEYRYLAGVSWSHFTVATPPSDQGTRPDILVYG